MACAKGRLFLDLVVRVSTLNSAAQPLFERRRRGTAYERHRHTHAHTNGEETLTHRHAKKSREKAATHLTTGGATQGHAQRRDNRPTTPETGTDTQHRVRKHTPGACARAPARMRTQNRPATRQKHCAGPGEGTKGREREQKVGPTKDGGRIRNQRPRKP